MKYRIISCILTAALTLSCVMPAFAEGAVQSPETSDTVQMTETSVESTETVQPQETTQPATTDSVETNEAAPAETVETPAPEESESINESESVDQTEESMDTDPLAANEDGTTTEDFVRRLYKILLLRDPDEKGLQDWTNLLNTGNQTGADIVGGFIHSPEFIKNGYSDEQYVSILYEAILGRQADAEGLSDWTGILKEGFSRDNVCSGFIASPEFKELCGKYGIAPGTLQLTSNVDLYPNVTRFVNRLYSLILSRDPDDKGRSEWVDALVSKRNTAAVAVLGFMDSNELKEKNLNDSDYLDILYRAILGREADAQGKSEWLEVTAMGVSRNYLLYNFIASVEFTDICNEYNIDRGNLTLTEPRDQDKFITGFIKQVYEMGLQRSASVTDLNNWAQDINGHKISARDFITGIVFSDEGKSKAATDADFVRMVYRCALLRNPGDTEVNNGCNAIKGSSRQSYLDSILSSSEFTKICEKYGLPYNLEGWNRASNGWYYISNGAVLSGWHRLNGNLYYFNPSNYNYCATGWNYIDGFKYYFNQDGVLIQNVDPIIGKQSSYYVKVNTSTNTVSVYAKDGANGYIIPVKNIICSCGNPGTPTVKGTFTISRMGYWWELMGPVWGQYVSRIYADWLFHSAWYYVNGNRRTLSVSEYRKLGQNASHGCVRLTVGDAKWIFDNCNGSTVTVYSSPYMENMFDKPARPNPVVISGDYGYDPTDPYFQ